MKAALRRILRQPRGTNHGHTEAHRARFTPDEVDEIRAALDAVDPDAQTSMVEGVAALALIAARAIVSEGR